MSISFGFTYGEQRRPTRDGPVARPIRAGDVHPGMRLSGVGWPGAPFTVLPDGVTATGAVVTLIGMDDQGDLVNVQLPADYLVTELLDPPTLDLSCNCGEDGCTGTWPVLDRSPGPLEARGPLLRITPTQIFLGLHTSDPPTGDAGEYSPLGGHRPQLTTTDDDPDVDDQAEEDVYVDDQPGQRPEGHGGYL